MKFSHNTKRSIYNLLEIFQNFPKSFNFRVLDLSELCTFDLKRRADNMGKSLGDLQARSHRSRVRIWGCCILLGGISCGVLAGESIRFVCRVGRIFRVFVISFLGCCLGRPESLVHYICRIGVWFLATDKAQINSVGPRAFGRQIKNQGSRS